MSDKQIMDLNIESMKGIIDGNFAGFKFKPKETEPVAKMWLSEFRIVFYDDFMSAVRYVRKHFSEFPQPKLFWKVLGDQKELDRMKHDDSEFRKLSLTAKQESTLAKNVFFKWWEWLYSKKTLTLLDNSETKGAVLYRYYKGCYDDYSALKIKKDKIFQMNMMELFEKIKKYQSFEKQAKEINAPA